MITFEQLNWASDKKNLLEFRTDLTKYILRQITYLPFNEQCFDSHK